MSRRMTGADAAWLQMDRPDNPMVVDVLLDLDRPVDLATVEQALRERLVARFPRFRMRAEQPVPLLAAVAPARWVDDDRFDVSRHVHEVPLDAPGDAGVLHRVVGEIASRHLPDDRPLWEVHLLTGGRAGSALLLRTHHAMADGTALMHVVDALTDDAGGRPTAAGPAAGRTRLPRGAGPTITPLDPAAVQADAEMLAKLGRVVAAPPEPAALGGVLDGSKAVARGAPVPLDAVKAAGHAVGGTANDTLLAAVAGAIRRHLVRTRGACPDVEVVVPVNVRGDAPLDELGNRFGLVFVPLPVHHDDPLDRLREAKAEMDRIKASRESGLVAGALTVLGYTTPLAEHRWVDRFARRASAVVTNIPGPARARCLAGAPVTGVTLWVPSTGPVGVGISFVSYDGSVHPGLIVDTAVVADPDELVADLAAELDELVGRA